MDDSAKAALTIVGLAGVLLFGFYVAPKMFPQKLESTVLYDEQGRLVGTEVKYS